MMVAILAVVYPCIILAMGFAVAISRRQMKRAQHQSAQYREMLREAHDFIFFMGSMRGQLVGDLESIEKAIAEEQRSRQTVKARSN